MIDKWGNEILVEAVQGRFNYSRAGLTLTLGAPDAQRAEAFFNDNLPEGVVLEGFPYQPTENENA